MKLFFESKMNEIVVKGMTFIRDWNTILLSILKPGDYFVVDKPSGTFLYKLLQYDDQTGEIHYITTNNRQNVSNVKQWKSYGPQVYKIFVPEEYEDSKNDARVLRMQDDLEKKKFNIKQIKKEIEMIFEAEGIADKVKSGRLNCKTWHDWWKSLEYQTKWDGLRGIIIDPGDWYSKTPATFLQRGMISNAAYDRLEELFDELHSLDSKIDIRL